MSARAPIPRGAPVAAARVVVVALIVAVFAGLLAPSPANALSDEETSAEVDYVGRINDIRKSNGLRPLVEDIDLNREARGWAVTMSTGVCGPFPLCHDPDLTGGISSSWYLLGENVGIAGWGLNSLLMSTFMGSPQHRVNLLDSRYTRVGVGVAHVGNMQSVVHKFMAVPGEVISTNAPSQQRYVDVRYDHPFYGDIEWASVVGVALGYWDRMFRPTTSVTRQAMASFLYRMAGMPGGTFPNPGYRDVPTSHPFYREIAWLTKMGIGEGFPDGTFKPKSNVTRQAAAVYLYNMAGRPVGPFPNPGFSDVPSTHPFFKEISWLVWTGISGGYPNNTFRPGNNVTRQAVTVFLHRFDAL